MLSIKLDFLKLHISLYNKQLACGTIDVYVLVFGSQLVVI